MLIDEIKKRSMQAMKDRDTVAKEVLRVALGEIQVAEARAGRDATDEDSMAAVRKLIKSNEETRAVSTDEAQKATLTREIEVLSALLPKSLGVDEIVAALEPVREALRAAKSDGQATGVAMKHLKSTGAVVNGNDVSAAVRQVRA
jgi:uncharacterized protein YqeY